MVNICLYKSLSTRVFIDFRVVMPSEMAFISRQKSFAISGKFGGNHHIAFS